jgi:hypothetical protein
MNKRDLKKSNLLPGKRGGQAAALLGLMALLLGSNCGFGEESSLTKYQIEAVFLLNFAKYVDWPAAAFPDAAAPITIGIIGTDPFGDNLQHTVEGKSINGRSFVIKHLASGSVLSGCQILFISHSEAATVGGILEKSGVLPILTVGEDEMFARNGGIIKFVLRNGNVRLEIDLAAARKAGLTISSRLLAVADVVKGKAI